MDLIDPWICKSCDLNVGRIIRESQYGDNILSFKLNFTKIMWNKGCVLGFTDFVWLLLSTMIIDILTWGNFRSSAEAASTDAFLMAMAVTVLRHSCFLNTCCLWSGIDRLHLVGMTVTFSSSFGKKTYSLAEMPDIKARQQ